MQFVSIVRAGCNPDLNFNGSNRENISQKDLLDTIAKLFKSHSAGHTANCNWQPHQQQSCRSGHSAPMVGWAPAVLTACNLWHGWWLPKEVLDCLNMTDMLHGSSCSADSDNVYLPESVSDWIAEEEHHPEIWWLGPYGTQPSDDGQDQAIPLTWMDTS